MNALPGVAARPRPPAVPLHRIVLDSPVGPIEVVGDGLAVTEVTIARRGTLPRAALGIVPDEVLDAAAVQLAEYFDGKRLEFDVPLAPSGNEFQRRVWDRIAAIPFGLAATYSRVGADLGYAREASRAIGTATGANPITILIPCHRVLAADGRITGYSGGEGIPTKQFLLDHEGIPYR
ncbi:MAG: methylated-DNA--[protein]-cysteine S-methyltransferase [Microbacteriaceae bacterium]|nr:methylated-DNA--[protein]-cysteine S-methyltransferase [Microbacteriaceae bacterium]